MIAVHSDRVNFVEIGQRPIFVGEVADLGDRRDVRIHRIDAFERDELRQSRVALAQQLFEVVEVVVAKHALLAAAVPDPGDHRSMVERIGEDHASR